MADASSPLRVKKIPDTLYEVCLINVVKAKCDKNALRGLPDIMLMDVYYKMLQEKCLCVLGGELASLDVFERLLRFSGSRLPLLQCFQAVIEHGSKLPTELSSSYLKRSNSPSLSKDYLIHLGLRLGGFLNEAGWYADAEQVLIRCRDLCQSMPQTTYYKRLTLECCHRLLNTQSAYCCFPAAAETYNFTLKLLGITDDDSSADDIEGALAVGDAVHMGVQTDCDDDSAEILNRLSMEPDDEEISHILNRLQDTEASEPQLNAGRSNVWGMGALLAQVCKEISALFFVRCNYNHAHRWGLRALALLTPHTPPKITIEVLRACGTACVVKRSFRRAGLALRAAVGMAARQCGVGHPRHAAALLDHGFYLLNIDSINHSVAVYEEALAALRLVFGRGSLQVARAQEDLAYALYVLEYSSGRFYKARGHAEKAIRIIENLVPPEHLLLASAKRVKALILEEIALDTPAGQDTTTKPTLLAESESLHKAALELSMMAFGEKNVQTAKHYGNLGRLYQSMHKFKDAEEMHLKAIAIKEELLGPEDYEVGLSIGHLASLYNYHMELHSAAETLYLRSIAISLKLFGERYSGLEYDYRGLVHVFTQLKRHRDAAAYTRLLQRWHELREKSKTEQQPSVHDEEHLSLEELRAKFFAPND